MSLLEALTFFPLAILAVIGAVGMVVARNPVHSALFLILNFFALAGIFLTLLAPLLAVLQVIVYAGAIMVLFLYAVFFFIQPGQRFTLAYSLPAQALLGSLVIIVLFTLMLYTLYRGSLFSVPSIGAAESFKRGEIFPINAFGSVLFSRYLLPFELTSLLLLSAMIGAVVMTRAPRNKNILQKKGITTEAQGSKDE